MNKRPYRDSTPGPSSKRPRLNPKLASSSSEWSYATEVIWNHSRSSKQSPELFHKKKNLRDALFAITKDIFPYCGLFIVGSSLSGFGSNSSDMDLCLMVSHVELDQRQEATRILSMLLKAFRKLTFLRDLQLIRAKVPILKFTDRIGSIECDLNINNSVGIRNTHLLNSYSHLDPRVAPLVHFVKFWAKHHGINDASQGTISSYSLSLMVLHYLQCGCDPPALPSLQLMYPETFRADQDIRQISLDEELPSYSSSNHQSLGELFYGFLNYFANNFDFETDAISVRLGRKLRKLFVKNQNLARNPPTQWKFLCIEEPFDLSNTARSVFDQNTFLRIFRIFCRSWDLLRATKDIDRLIREPI